MNRGTIIVTGSAGNEVGAMMRRGLIAVLGERGSDGGVDHIEGIDGFFEGERPFLPRGQGRHAVGRISDGLVIGHDAEDPVFIQSRRGCGRGRGKGR